MNIIDYLLLGIVRQKKLKKQNEENTQNKQM